MKIEFSPIFYEGISKGQKTATIRLGHYNGEQGRELYTPGEFQLVFSEQQSLRGVITDVRYVKFQYHPDHISDEVLLAEGFSTANQESFDRLYQGMLRWYPDFQHQDPVTIVFFRLVQPQVKNHNP